MIILITFNDPILPMLIWLVIVAIMTFFDLKTFFEYEVHATFNDDVEDEINF